jgi:3-deoxy-D-manno-octulosonic acid kinase
VKARAHKQDNLVIVYDADHIRHPGEYLFDPGYWEDQGALLGKATGRASVLFLETEFGPAVLKQYLRGGWAARVSRHHYVFSGFERSRSLMEFKILEQLSAAGLPAPEPLAAICRRDGKFYTAWLMTRRIMNAEPLADLIATRRGDPVMWRNTGVCIRRFHGFGLVHADLNARNILVGEDDVIHLVDFDRSRVRQGDSRACAVNLRRLHRSLEKNWPDSFKGYLESCWILLLQGYDAERTGA